MVAGWCMRVSKNPVLYAVSLWKGGNTYKLIRESKEFVIAVPNKELESALCLFGSTHGNKIDKFKETGLKIEKAKIVKSPLLSDATFNFECKLWKEVDAGDHFIYMGEVVAAYQNKDKKVLLNMGRKESDRIFKEF